MAARKYRKLIQAQGAGGANLPNFATGNFRWCLVDSALVPANTAIGGHEFHSDISAGIIAETASFTGTFVDGLFDAADQTLPDTGGGGTGEYLVLVHWTGTSGTSRLCMLSDDATNLPLTLDGVDDEIQHNASGIMQFG